MAIHLAWVDLSLDPSSVKLYPCLFLDNCMDEINHTRLKILQNNPSLVCEIHGTMDVTENDVE